MELDSFRNWVEFNGNPIIKPKFPDWIIADPTFITPDKSPDGRWHLFAHCIIRGIQHFISNDGINWVNTKQKLFSGIRPFIFREDDTFYLFYEELLTPFSNSKIVVRTSNDLLNWSEPRNIIKPNLKWEGKIIFTNSNPCVIFYRDKYILYYSANSVFLHDCLFNEPKYIGIAFSESIADGYKKRKAPIIIPDKNNKYRNLGAGAIKVIQVENGKLIGFNNGIYLDKYKRSRSSILMLISEDGINWRELFNKPIIYPTSGWKRAFVYQLDVKKFNNKYWLYFNARDGWFYGVERIGLATLEI